MSFSRLRGHLESRGALFSTLSTSLPGCPQLCNEICPALWSADTLGSFCPTFERFSRYSLILRVNHGFVYRYTGVKSHRRTVKSLLQVSFVAPHCIKGMITYIQKPKGHARYRGMSPVITLTIHVTEKSHTNAAIFRRLIVLLTRKSNLLAWLE